MTVAFSDCYQLSKVLNGLDLLNDHSMRLAFDTFKAERKSLSSTINILAAGLYGVFGVSDGTHIPLEAHTLCYQTPGTPQWMA